MRSAVIAAIIGSALAVQPTTTAPAGGDSCVESCSDAYNKCRTEPGANMSSCASEYSSCLGYSPFGGDGSLITPTACSKTQPTATTAPAGGDSCVEACSDAYNKCRTEPGANMSACASEYSSCLGYSPFKDGSLVTPTACSTTAAPTTTTAPAGDQCVEECSDAYNKCRTEPDANMSACASEYSSCLGYSPFEGGSLVTPTACSKSAAPTTTAPAGEQCPVKICNTKYDKCRSESGANMSACASEYSSCLGYNPFGPDGSLNPPKECGSASPSSSSPSSSFKGNGTAPVQPTQPVIVSGVGFVKPAGALALLAVAAVALI